jgi:hypothetical protein
MANLILPNGQTIQTDNPAEIAEFMARGAQDQSAAVAASPGQTIQQIASERGQAWNSQGGQGYLEAMRQGHNDPTSNPSAPAAFSNAALTAAGINPETYQQQRLQQNAGVGAFEDFGFRPEFNRNLVAYARGRGYNVDFNNIGEGQVQAWLNRLPAAEADDMRSWIAANDPGSGGGLLTPPTITGGGLLGGGGGGGNNGGFPASTIPIFSNVGGMSQQPSMQPSMPMPSMAAPTIGNFEAQQVTPAPQTFDDILAKYSLHSTPLQNGTGFNWITPQTTPGSVNVMDANLSRRYL